MAENIFDRIVIERVDLDITIGPKTFKLSGDKEYIINAEHVILANGSQSVELPFMPFDKNIISSNSPIKNSS